jgi:hypothetical protein
MGSKEWMQGMITFTALAGMLQAVVGGALTMQDIIFLILVTAFFIALEHDYYKYKLRMGGKNGENNSHFSILKLGWPSPNKFLFALKNYYFFKIFYFSKREYVFILSQTFSF